MSRLNVFESTICRYTGKVFRIAMEHKLDVVSFIDQYMNCEVAEILDTGTYRYPGCGPHYLFRETMDLITPIADYGRNAKYSGAVLDWAGYYYRAWNYLTLESSKEISRVCPAERMLGQWFYGHTVDIKLFVEDMHNAWWNQI